MFVCDCRKGKDGCLLWNKNQFKRNETKSMVISTIKQSPKLNITSDRKEVTGHTPKKMFLGNLQSESRKYGVDFKRKMELTRKTFRQNK